MKKIVCNSFKSSNAGIFQINSRFSEFVVDGKVLRCKLYEFYVKWPSERRTPFIGGSIFYIMENCKIESENVDRIFASTLKSVVIDGFQ